MSKSKPSKCTSHAGEISKDPEWLTADIKELCNVEVINVPGSTLRLTRLTPKKRLKE